MVSLISLSYFLVFLLKFSVLWGLDNLFDNGVGHVEMCTWVYLEV